MTGFNLPPGCEVHHLPGNTPADLAEEAWWDKFLDRLARVGIPESLLPEDDWFVKVVTEARDLAYADGFAEGRAEEQMAQALGESESVHPQPQGQTIEEWEARHGSVADDNPS